MERLNARQIVILGERQADLAVRLTYADIPYARACDLRHALSLLRPGVTDVIANYTSFRDIAEELTRVDQIGDPHRVMLPDLLGTYGDSGNAVSGTQISRSDFVAGDGQRRAGLDLLDITTAPRRHRTVGEIVVRPESRWAIDLFTGFRTTTAPPVWPGRSAAGHLHDRPSESS